MKPIYHEGELAVQAQAGVREMASRIGKSIRSTIPLAAKGFLSSQPIAVLSSIDQKGRVWASLLAGKPGFMQALDEKTIRIQATTGNGDPFAENILQNDQVGLIVIEFATRHRMRINGTAKIDDHAIHIHSEQVYSNCPKYIQARTWESKSESNDQTSVQHSTEFSDQQLSWIRNADTFFIASHHREGGADASHRGGNPGFIQVLDKNTLRFPDYSGNTMFQTLGNISVNPNCGLLFIDFDRGATLQITGTAKIIWDRNQLKEFSGAERSVEFRASEIIEIACVIPLRWEFQNYSPHNPAVK
jgi:predicted pyridoxine 5'-phosphate oxidase superfamily flavin-nucleotide-binding protein